MKGGLADVGESHAQSVSCAVCVRACMLAAGGSGHVGLAHAQASGARPSSGASQRKVAPGWGLALELAGRAV